MFGRDLTAYLLKLSQTFFHLFFFRLQLSSHSLIVCLLFIYFLALRNALGRVAALRWCPRASLLTRPPWHPLLWSPMKSFRGSRKLHLRFLLRRRPINNNSSSSRDSFQATRKTFSRQGTINRRKRVFKIGIYLLSESATGFFPIYSYFFFKTAAL